jgi:inorganic pyrophosphatase
LSKSAKSKRRDSLSRLSPFNKKKDSLQVVTETPKGSRNKYAFDEKQNVFALKKVLPAGMAFPYDFGFVPSMVAGDGDRVDVLVLMDEPAAVGCLLQCRIIRIIEGEQGSQKNRERNDRIVAIERANHSFAASVTSKIWGKCLCTSWKNFRQLSRSERRKIQDCGCRGTEPSQ